MMDGLKAAILAEIQAHEDSMKILPGDIFVEDVIEVSAVSDKTAQRILKDMAKAGKVKPVKVRAENGYIKVAYRPVTPPVASVNKAES